MTTGDEGADRLVGDLERDYHLAREDLAKADVERREKRMNPLEASNERYELMSQVASLQAEVSRQADELDERDRLLGQLSENIAGFEAAVAELDQAKHQATDARREQSRLSALLDARAAEREELASVAQRMQNERDHVQELLETALARFDEVDAVRIQLDDKLRHLEAARDTAAHEHDVRAHELIECRAEMSKLADQLSDLQRSADTASEQAERADALAERRANEAGYLNRRIDALNDKLDAASQFETEAAGLRRELAMTERRVTELERELATQESEAAAARAAVDAIAEKTADYDELVAQVATLEEERDAAWEAASGYITTPASTDVEPDEVSALAAEARELSARRANEAEAAALAAESAAAAAAEIAAEEAAAQRAVDSAPLWKADAAESEPESDPALPEAELAGAPELQDLDSDDERLIDSDLDHVRLDEPDDAPASDVTEFDGTEPVASFASAALAATSDITDSAPEPTSEIPALTFDATDAEPAEAVEPPTTQFSLPTDIDVPSAPPIEAAEPPTAQVVLPADSDMPPALLTEAVAVRKRMILPADLVPNTPDAVSHLLNQPGVTAIVDARSTCARTGVRPSELFERVAELRDHFDVPVEVVVTPVSTPVGGAPDLPAIGVHYVTGADTVADRVRALCMGFPADQPLVVIAGDDHVRRAAIGEEANVVEPAAVLNLAAG